VLDIAQQQQHLKESGQSTMFDLWGTAVDVPTPGLEMVDSAATTKEKLDWEKELTGVYLSEHPFSPYTSQAAEDNTTLRSSAHSIVLPRLIEREGLILLGFFHILRKNQGHIYPAS
jgi:DNA polymerase III alpha subunit